MHINNIKIQILCKTTRGVKEHPECPKDNAFATTTTLVLSCKESSLESRPRATACKHSDAHVSAEESSGPLNQIANQSLFLYLCWFSF